MARHVNTMVENTFYISPEGKRFQSLEAAKTWLSDSEIIDYPKKVSRRVHEEKAEAELEYALNNYRVALPENIKRRRKMMSSRSPFNNLLKVTLNRNYKIKKRQEDKMKRKPLLGWWRDPRKRKALNQRIVQMRPKLSMRREG